MATAPAVLTGLGILLVAALGRRRRVRCAGASLRVVFVHPDLGLGGAERLVVDAALAAAARGHSVCVYTSHYDPSRCFEETKGGRFEIVVGGDWIPRSIAGRAHILCAVARGIALAAYLLAREAGGAHVAFVDQLSIAVPLLRLGGLRVVFYCHFPDKLLARTQRLSLAKRLYRLPFDAAEELTTGCAHALLVNSAYTRAVFARSFPLLSALRAAPEVLHPCVDLARIPALPPPAPTAPSAAALAFLSLNRFERKKELGLALRALAAMRPAARARARLVVAGGYDERVRENVEYYAELVALAAQLGVESQVEFRRSVDDAERARLMSEALAVVYTPAHEHFGIVPLEAMAAARCVIAADSGGPLETIAHGETGWLCVPTAAAFGAALERCVDEPDAAVRMGRAGRERVRDHFSAEVFGARLEEAIAGQTSVRSRPRADGGPVTGRSS